MIDVARGIVYHVTHDADAFGGMSASTFYDSMDAMGCDIIDDQAPEDAAESVARLRAALEKAEFTVEDGPAGGIEIVTKDNERILDRAKSNWFRKRFNKLKQRVTLMPLHEFATDVLCPSDLKAMISDDHGDKIWYDGGDGACMYSLDGFIRRMRPGRRYLVAPNTVYIH